MEELWYQQSKENLPKYEIINQDKYLEPFGFKIAQRVNQYKRRLYQIEKSESIDIKRSLENFAMSYEKMGIIILPNGDIKYREYAPGAERISIFGEFNNWNKEQYWAYKDDFDFWEVIIKNENGAPRIQHGQIVKINVVLEDGNWMERNPIWSHYLVQNKETLILDNIFGIQK